MNNLTEIKERFKKVKQELSNIKPYELEYNQLKQEQNRLFQEKYYLMEFAENLKLQIENKKSISFSKMIIDSNIRNEYLTLKIKYSSLRENLNVYERNYNDINNKLNIIEKEIQKFINLSNTYLKLYEKLKTMSFTNSIENDSMIYKLNVKEKMLFEKISHLSKKKQYLLELKKIICKASISLYSAMEYSNQYISNSENILNIKVENINKTKGYLNLARELITEHNLNNMEIPTFPVNQTEILEDIEFDAICADILINKISKSTYKKIQKSQHIINDNLNDAIIELNMEKQNLKLIHSSLVTILLKI